MLRRESLYFSAGLAQDKPPRGKVRGASSAVPFLHRSQLGARTPIPRRLTAAGVPVKYSDFGRY